MTKLKLSGILFLLFALDFSCMTMKGNSNELELDIVDDNTLQKVVIVDGIKSDIYNKLTIWAKKSILDDSVSPILYNDLKNEISGTGSIVLPYYGYAANSYYFGAPLRIHFTMYIEVKDNRFRLTLSGFHVFSQSVTEFGTVGPEIRSDLYGDSLNNISNAFYKYRLLEKIMKTILQSNDDEW